MAQGDGIKGLGGLIYRKVRNARLRKQQMIQIWSIVYFCAGIRLRRLSRQSAVSHYLRQSRSLWRVTGDFSDFGRSRR
jgi:hypothetical protein